MNLEEMKTAVRRDLHDEDAANYRWTDDEIERHIEHALRLFSLSLPYDDSLITPTVAGSTEIDISAITDLVTVEAVEYPTGNQPAYYCRFRLRGNTVTLLDGKIPDGSDARILYGKLHTLESSSTTIPPAFDDIIITGACGYAAVEWAVFAMNRVNTGGTDAPRETLDWGKQKLNEFNSTLKKIGRYGRLRVRQFSTPVAQ
jgi:hypothetical protein